MTELATAPEVARLVADALEAASIPYAIGGAIAYGFHAPPRATNDVDVNAFVGPERVEALLDALERAGATVDREMARATAEGRGELAVRLRGMRVDVFIDSIPLHASARRRAKTVTLLGRPIVALSAEDLAVLKLLFFRPKDVIDVERLVAFRGRDLDRAYVRGWLVDLLGEDDERIERWDAVTAAFPPTD